MNYAEIIKERVSSREVLEAEGIRVNPHTGMAVCPFHGDHDGSLKVYTDARRGWHCYGCHAGGDVIDLVKLLYGVGFRDALRLLNDRFALGLPLERRLTRSEIQALEKERREKEARRARHKAACDALEAAYWRWFEAWLLVDEAIRVLAPAGPYEPMSEAFIWAVTHRDEIESNMDDAKERWLGMRDKGRG